MPVLKIDPNTGQSLDKAKTPEQIAAEQAATEAFYNKRKRNAKLKKKRKPELVIDDPIVVVNPFLAPNNELSVEDLITPFNKLLEASEKNLEKISKEFKIKPNLNNDELVLNKPKNTLKVNYESDISTYKHLPISIEYVPTLTVNPSKYELFESHPGKKKVVKDKKYIIVDRVMFNALDVKTLLGNPKEAKVLIAKLIKDMYTNIVNMKYLNSNKKYFGSVVASIAVPGQKKKYALNYKDEFLEVRMFSDLTEITG